MVSYRFGMRRPRSGSGFEGACIDGIPERLPFDAGVHHGGSDFS